MSCQFVMPLRDQLKLLWSWKGRGRLANGKVKRCKFIVEELVQRGYLINIVQELGL